MEDEDAPAVTTVHESVTPPPPSPRTNFKDERSSMQHHAGAARHFNMEYQSTGTEVLEEDQDKGADGQAKEENEVVRRGKPTELESSQASAVMYQ